MQSKNNLKAMFIYMMAAFVGIFVCGSFVSCSKDDVTGHDNNGNAVMSVKVEKPDTTKPAPTVILKDSTYGIVRNDTLILRHDSLKNNTLFKRDSLAFAFNASISRKFDERKTTVERLKKLDFSFNEAENKQNGKMEYYGAQTGNDLDGQNYTVDFKSGKGSLGSIVNAHFELVGTDNTGVKSTEIEKKASDSIRVNSEMSWNIAYRIANVPNLAGKSFRKDINQTSHERFISYGDAVLIKRDTTMVPTIGVWSTEWLLKVVETYRVNGHDSIAPAQTKKVNLVSTCGIDKLEDAFVGSLDFNHSFNSEKWSNWYDVESNDKAVSVQERKFERLGTGSNGIAKDEFATRSFVTEQKATVVFAGLTWDIPATDAKLTNVRHTFLEEASDIDGYSMLKFVDDEIATYGGATEGNNYKKLNSSCKLYLKVAAPAELDKIEFVGTKIHANNKVSIDGSVIPVFTDGTKGGAISFKWEKAEEWYWKKDSVIFNDVDFFMQETSALKLKDTESKTEKTFATSNDDITIKCNQYDADFQVGVKVDGGVKYTTWHATWYEDFKVVYNNKSVSLTKSSYSVKNANDKLTKDEARSNATSEVWGYSVEGIFSIDEDSRSAMGYGRLTKAIEEVVIEEGWDKFSFETDAKEYSDRVEYFLKWIKEYSTGKKTSQDVKVILKRNAEGSAYTITVDDPQREIGSQSENSSYVSRTETASDIIINYDWKTSVFELPNYFDGSTIEKSDIATFVDPTNVRVSKKNSKGEDVEISLPSFEHTLTSTVSELEKVSETEELVEYTYTRTWSWASTQCTSSVKSIGNINKVPEYGGGEPDFDLEIGSIFATVSRPSNRNGNPITAYTYLLVSKDGTKCLPIGIYNDVVTEGKIQDMHSTYNGACYVKDQNDVVPTNCYSHNGLGMMIWADKDGNPIDAETHTWLQGNGFNDRGNDWINHTGKYAPRAEKVGNLVKVTFEGTNVSYTFRGWDVK